MKNIRLRIASFVVVICLLLSACSETTILESEAISTNSSAIIPQETEQTETIPETPQTSKNTFSIEDIAPYTDQPFVIVNNNIPYFSESDLTTESFETYSDLDEMGRCGTAYANICIDIMPTEERGEIGQIKPTGWHLIKYDNIYGKYLYNRAHLIGYQLSGENANEKNLITSTRYMNVVGMLPFENLVADYVKETENHVLYRVTPIFEEGNLLASGVLMEAQSVEDNGDGVLFCVYVYNVQPDIIIDYAIGESRLDPNAQTTVPESTTISAPAATSAPATASTPAATSASATTSTPTTASTPSPESTPDPASEQQVQKTEESSEQTSVVQEEPQGIDYILNTNTHKFHYPSCSSVDQMSDKNKWEYNGSREDIISMGYDPCKRCNP